MNYNGKWLFSFLFLLYFLPINAQKIFFEQFTTAEGLPSDYINCVFENSKGHLWIGTDKGACYYDGKQFQYFSNDNGLTSNFVSCFAEDASGNIWIGTVNGGVCKYDGRAITQFPLQGNDKASILRIWFNKDSSFFILSEKSGLYFFESEFSPPQFFPDMAFIKMLKPDFLITGSLKQLFIIELRNRQLIFHPLAHPAADKGNFYYWLGDNTIIALKENSFFEYITDGDQWILKKEFFLDKLIPFPVWTDIKNVVINNDELFIATANGLIYIDNVNKQYFFKAENGLGSNYVKSIYKDRRNNIYICTYGAGIKIWPTGYLEEYKTNGKVTSIFHSEKTTYITTTKNVYRLHSPGRLLYEFKNQDAGNFTSIYKDLKGQVFLGTLNNFYKLPDENYLNNTGVNGKINYSFDANTGTSGFVEHKKRIYISTYGDGMYIFDGNNKMTDTLNAATNPAAHFIIESLVPVNTSFAALTYNSGLIIYDSANSSTILSRKDGLLSNTVYSVFAEKENEIWIGTQTGLNLFDGKKIIKTFSFANGLIGTKVICIFRDAINRFWVLSDNYLHLIEKDRLRAIRSHPILYDKKNVINRATFNQTTNTLFIGLTDALLKVDMNKVIPDTLVNMPALLAVKKDTTFLFPDKEGVLSLSFPASKIIFQFAALHYSVARQPELYYKLSGYDDEWKLLGDKTEIVYAKLPPGNYELISKTVNPDGYESAETGLLKLEVIPPVWKRNWFIAAAAAVFLGLFFYIGNIISRRRYKQKLLHLEEEYRLQLERERIARELHDNVGSQLTYLINKIDDDYPRLAEKKEAEKLSSFARGAMQELRETIWALDKKEVHWDDMENKIRQLSLLYKTEKHSVELVWKINGHQSSLNPLEALNIYRIIQEALNNAEKYSNASLIKVSAHFDNKQVCVEITDNGKGYDREKTEKGYGLKNMKKRAEEMNATLQIESEPGKGTTVKLYL